MGQLFGQNGQSIPVTEIRVEPTIVTQVKSRDKDGYQAIQLAIESNRKYRREFRIPDGQSRIKIKKGDKFDGRIFDKTKTLYISGIAKGHGFQGVIKRHGFSRGPMTHGSHHHRGPGSIGQCETPSRVFKGKKMPGRLGSQKVTIKKIELIKNEKDRLFVKGPVPGPKNNFLILRSHDGK